MTQTSNTAPRESQSLTRNEMWKLLMFYSGFPLLLILITQSLVSTPGSVIVVETIVIFVLYLKARAVQKDNGPMYNDLLRNNMMVFATAYVLLRLAYNNNLHANPWGTIGWAILWGVIALIFGIFFINMKKGFTWREVVMSMDIWEMTSSLVLASLAIQQTYLHWATLWVWIPLLMTWVFLFSFENPKFSWSGEDLGNNDKEERNKWFVLILFSIGIISLICEFWNPILQTVRNALQKVISLWPYWLSVLTFFAIILGVRNLRKRYLIKIANRRMLEERRRETAAREEYNRQQLENAQEEYTSLNNYFAGKIGETPQAIYWEKICKLWSLSRKYAVLRFGTEERWITAPILPLFEYSEIKNQIVYEGGLIKTILDVLEGVMYECFDDGILATLKINLQALRKFEGTIGYDNLVKLINEKTLVKKFYAEEKEVA